MSGLDKVLILSQRLPAHLVTPKPLFSATTLAMSPIKVRCDFSIGRQKPGQRKRGIPGCHRRGPCSHGHQAQMQLPIPRTTSTTFTTRAKSSSPCCKAYADDTDQETMHAQRMDGILSKRRDRSVGETLRIFSKRLPSWAGAMPLSVSFLPKTPSRPRWSSTSRVTSSPRTRRSPGYLPRVWSPCRPSYEISNT